MYINVNHQQIIPSISMMYIYHHMSHINDTFHEKCLIFTIHHLLVLSREWMGLGVAGMMKLLVIVDHSRKFPAFSTSKSNHQNPTSQHVPYLHIFTIHHFHHQQISIIHQFCERFIESPGPSLPLFGSASKRLKLCTRTPQSPDSCGGDPVATRCVGEMLGKC